MVEEIRKVGKVCIEGKECSIVEVSGKKFVEIGIQRIPYIDRSRAVTDMINSFEIIEMPFTPVSTPKKIAISMTSRTILYEVSNLKIHKGIIYYEKTSDELSDYEIDVLKKILSKYSVYSRYLTTVQECRKFKVTLSVNAHVLNDAMKAISAFTLHDNDFNILNYTTFYSPSEPAPLAACVSNSHIALIVPDVHVERC